MTILGKILVFVNLVFSLVVGSLIIMVYATRTNWYDGYKKLEHELEVARASARASSEEVREIQRRGDTRVKEVEARLTEAIAATDAERTAHNATKDLLQRETKKVTGESASVASLATDVQRRDSEVKKLEEALKERETRILQLVNSGNKLRDEAVAKKLEADALRDRNMRLVAQMETLIKENAQMKTSGSATVRASYTSRKENPPPADVEGVVEDTDMKQGLVTISLGSDDGLTKGHTLDVYRLQPKETWLGQIRILDVRAHKAVGMPIGATRVEIRKGDRVGVILPSDRRPSMGFGG